MKKRYNQRYHKTLEEGVKKKKTIKNLGTRKAGGYSKTIKKRYLKYNI